MAPPASMAGLYNPYDRLSQHRALSGFNIRGDSPPPYIPFSSFVDQRGRLDPRLRQDENRFFGRLAQGVGRRGPTTWGQQMLDRSKLGLQDTLGGLRMAGQRGLSQGYDALASRGHGLGGGARERIARDIGIGQIGAHQQAYQDATKRDLGILGQDFLTKQDILQQLEGRGRGMDQANIATRLGERNMAWQDILNRRNELLRAWGGFKEAQAI